jgi:hypothetical protein
MPQSSRTNPSEWGKTLGLAAFSLALGLGSLGLAVYLCGKELHEKGQVDSNTLVGASIFALFGMMMLTFGAFLLPKGLRERREQQQIAAATSPEVNVQVEAGGWSPGPGVTGHGGRALLSDGDYFVPPPAEIGTVVSAYTSLRKGVRPRGALVCVLAAAGLATVGLVLGWSVMLLIEPKDSTAGPCVGGILALLGALSGWALARFKHACSYVGREGIARFVCTGSRDHLTVKEVFLFRAAAELRTSATQRYSSGVYQGTDFRFDWSDRAGQICFQITGTYRSSPEGNNPWLHMPYQWGQAAEVAWGLYRQEQLPGEFVQGGALNFPLTGDDWLRVSPGVLEIHKGGQTTRCTPEDIEEFSLAAGVFTLRLRGGREGFFSSTGVFKFGYDDVANVQLFLLTLERLFGITFRS